MRSISGLGRFSVAFGLWSALIAATLSTGCDSDDDDEPSIDELPAQYADALCSVLQECTGQLSDVFLSFIGATDCSSHFRAQIEDGQFQHTEAAIDDQRVTYNAGKVDACLKAITDGGCTVLDNNIPTACDEVLVGDTAPGMACVVNDECAGDAYCKTGMTCPGTCTSRGASGAFCEEDDECARGLKCDARTQACAKPRIHGESCEGNQQPDCASGLFCAGSDNDQDQPGVCRFIDEVFAATTGQDCSLQDSVLCAAGLSCVAKSVTDVTCQPSVASGGVCYLGFPSQCPKNEYCDATFLDLEGRCIALPVGGEPCAAEGTLPPCATGHICDTTTGSRICRPWTRIGGSCPSDDTCYSEICSGGTCVAPPTCEIN